MRDYSKPLENNRDRQLEAISVEFPDALIAARWFTSGIVCSNYETAVARILVNEPRRHHDAAEWLDYWHRILFAPGDYAERLTVKRYFEGAINAHLTYGLWDKHDIVTVELGTLRLDDVVKLLDIEEHHHMAALILDQAQAIHNLG
jgi:hypothetical protein